MRLYELFVVILMGSTATNRQDFCCRSLYCAMEAIQIMSTDHDTAETLDVQGANCPMPVMKTKQAIDDRDTEEMLEVLATDPGSMSDIKGWASSTAGVELVDQIETEGDGEEIYKHYVRKTE